MTRRGNAQWSLGSIQLILRNPVYAGYFDYTDNMLGETVRVQTPAIIDPHLFQIAQDKRKATREHKHQVNPSKHFYLLRGVLFCGHCGSPMGGRTHKAGHQHVYYCVRKERTWKTREDDHPKWKRGTGCSMIRSINIGKTDQLVWTMITDTLRQIRERSPVSCDPVGTEHHVHNDRDGVLTDGVTWMSPEQIDLLSDEEKKVVVSKMITRITAHFDQSTNKHRVDVTFSETVARQLAVPAVDLRACVDPENQSEDNAACICIDGEDDVEDRAVKKPWGSWGTSAADRPYPVTVE